MNIKEKFGKKVKFLRTQRGWSQEAFAHKANLDRTYIPSIEKGERNVSITVIKKISIALDISVSELLKDI